MQLRRIVIFVVIIAAVAVWMPAAHVSRAADTPAAEVADQVIQNGWVVVDKVVAAVPGWIVVHSGDQAAGNPAIGWTYVPAGESDHVTVQIDMDKATASLSAMLHIDAGTKGKYEFPGADIPVKNGDAIVNTPFKVIGVDVDDQFVSDKNTVTIGKVIAQDDGWITLHASSEGFPAVGHAPIKAGVNEDVSITLDDASKATPEMTAMIHVDAGTKGTYEFPGPDAPAMLGNAISNEPFWTVDHVRAMDQLVGADKTVVVPYILAKQDGWIVIHSSAQGNPGIGFAPVKAGLNQDVKVPITGKLTENVITMLHIDAGTKGKYEFPGADTPVKDAAGNLVAPMMLAGNGVTVHDQTADTIKSSGWVGVDSVVAAKNGWLVIHSSAQGNPAIGWAYVHTGLNKNVWIKVKPADVTGTLLAMLHIDAGKAGVYEFPGADTPVKDTAGNVIAPKINTAAAMAATAASK